NPGNRLSAFLKRATLKLSQPVEVTSSGTIHSKGMLPFLSATPKGSALPNETDEPAGLGVGGGQRASTQPAPAGVSSMNHGQASGTGPLREATATGKQPFRPSPARTIDGTRAAPTARPRHPWRP